MSRRLLRGRVVTFLRAPDGPDDMGAMRVIEDGALLVADGLIEAVDSYPALAPHARGAVLVDHRPHILMPGFIDPHLHFPQVQVIASWGAELLDWLNTYTFPAEAEFGDPVHARAMAHAFFDALLRHGTTTAVAYCSVHPESAEAFFAEALRRNLRMIGGKVLMDRNAPENLRDTPRTGYDQSAALIARWHGVGRLGYAISPRFAITSSPEQMEATQALIAAYRDCHIQTHVSENLAEITLACQLYPDAPDYLGIYERYGMLNDKMLLGHALHLSDRERGVLAETGAHPVFCPTSNLFLGSGLFDEAGLRALGVSSAVASDIGGGTSYSMLTTLAEGYKVLKLRGQTLDPLRAFWWMTRGNAEVLGLAGLIGTLDAGSEADIVVLDSRATPEMALRMDRAGGLREELFVLQMMGDDRAVPEVYVAGEPIRPR